MKELKLITAYIFSLLIFPLGIFGLFHSSFFEFENNDLILYVKLSSIFIVAIAFFLAWYYANTLIRKDVLKKMDDFGTSIVNSDFEKISKKGLQKLSDEVISKLKSYEYSKFEFLGFCLPFFIASLTLTILGIFKNHNSILSYIISFVISILIIKFANAISRICNIKANNNGLTDILTNLPFSVKGIQFYNSTEFIKTKLKERSRNSLIETERQISKSVWSSFLYISIFFILIVGAYIVQKEYILENLFNIDNIEGIFIASLFALFMFLISFFKSTNLLKIKFTDTSKYQLSTSNNGRKKINTHNLFVAFHGIYFQDPTRLSDRPLISDLSFSILPGELVAITGENITARSYIFDLILKFYKPQSGQIYIAGSKIETVSRKDIRTIFGIFEEDFGLINGTVYENLEMVCNDSKKIIETAEKVGIDEILEDKLFDETGKYQVSQEVLLRLQIARTALQKPQILLIKAPKNFDSEGSERTFYYFIEYHAKKRTILLITDNPSSIIYSDKIIYISKTKALFGSHAELSRNKEYQKFINML